MFVYVHTFIVYDKSEALLRHDIAEIKLKLALNTNQSINQSEAHFEKKNYLLKKKPKSLYNLIMKNMHLVCDLLKLTPRNFISKDRKY